MIGFQLGTSSPCMPQDCAEQQERVLGCREAELVVHMCLYKDIFQEEDAIQLLQCCCCSQDSVWWGQLNTALAQAQGVSISLRSGSACETLCQEVSPADAFQCACVITSAVLRAGLRDWSRNALGSQGQSGLAAAGGAVACS